MESVALLVIAKEPLPGRAKTRLTPPCTPEQAARLAGASLLDTLDAVRHTPAARKVLIFEGDPIRWRPPGFEVIRQRGHGLAERLAAAFEDVGQPALLVGMDTPQLTPALLLDGVEALRSSNHDAVLGPALDGGYWSIGLRTPDRAAFAGVPMSEHSTCIRQRTRLHELGLRVHEQPCLRDVDTIEDARAVAAACPGSRFAAVLTTLRRTTTAPNPQAA
ncbi:MAG TPA: TIGR04282 family arsenosugar biosynthesis glycosyltransferase [Solirubrobacteraceae bacterium]|nr:TIGR04282 family arsenosugar biosynthesis glycosyltransferase [Solirubrobacteraceae bacterium]